MDLKEQIVCGTGTLIEIKKRGKGVKMAERGVPFDHSFTTVGDKKFDLIRVDLDVEHPTPGLLKMVAQTPGQLAARTDFETAELLRDTVRIHLQACRADCKQVLNGPFKSY